MMALKWELKSLIISLIALAAFAGAIYIFTYRPPKLALKALQFIQPDDGDSIFVVQSLTEMGEGYRVSLLLSELKKRGMSFRQSELFWSTHTASGLHIIQIFVPPPGMDYPYADETYFLLKRGSNKIIVKPIEYISPTLGEKLLSQQGVTLPAKLYAICADENDINQVLLLLIHFPYRAGGRFGTSEFNIPRYFLNLTDIKAIDDTFKLKEFERFVRDTTSIPGIPLPQVADFLTAEYYTGRHYSDSLFASQRANVPEQLYHDDIYKEKKFILKVLAKYKLDAQHIALPEIENNISNKNIYYYYSLPECVVYKLWYAKNRAANRIAHIRLMTPHGLWERFYLPNIDVNY